MSEETMREEIALLQKQLNDVKEGAEWDCKQIKWCWKTMIQIRDIACLCVDHEKKELKQNPDMVEDLLGIIDLCNMHLHG
jgi:hypothetical protein